MGAKVGETKVISIPISTFKTTILAIEKMSMAPKALDHQRQVENPSSRERGQGS